MIYTLIPQNLDQSVSNEGFTKKKRSKLIWNRFSRFSRSQLFFLPACYSFFLATPGMFGVKYVRSANLFFIFGFFSWHEECRPNKPEIILWLTFVFKQSVIVYSVCRFRTGRKNKTRTGRTVLQSVRNSNIKQAMTKDSVPQHQKCPNCQIPCGFLIFQAGRDNFCAF